MTGSQVTAQKGSNIFIARARLMVSATGPCLTSFLYYCEYRAVKYVLKSDGFPPSGAAEESRGQQNLHQLGFIAQEVEKVAPEVVFEDARGIKAVAYSRVVPILARALSEALERLDVLEKERVTTAACKNTWLATMGNSLWKTPFGLSIARDKCVRSEEEDKEAIARRRRVEAMNKTRPGDVLSESVTGQSSVEGYRDIEDGDKLSSQRCQQEEMSAAMLVQGQLLEENTALKTRVGELEKKILDVERRMRLIFGEGEIRSSAG